MREIRLAAFLALALFGCSDVAEVTDSSAIEQAAQQVHRPTVVITTDEVAGSLDDDATPRSG